MWKAHLQDRVWTKVTDLITLRVKWITPLRWTGEVSYNGKTEQVYIGASINEAKAACDDRAIVLCRQTIEDVTA